MVKKILCTLCLMSFALSAQAREIVFAVDATYPPMEMLDANKEIIGFCPDVVRAAGKAAGFTPVLKNAAWDGIFAALNAGNYDAISSSVSITDARKRAMDFSDPYFDVIQSVITAKDSSISAVTELKGKVLASQMGTSGYFACKKIEDAQAKPYDEIGLAVEDLYNGRVDAVIADAPIASGYALQNPQYEGKLKIAFSMQSENPEHLGIAVTKGNKEVLDLINKGLATIKANGEYEKIYQKWFEKKAQ